MARITLSISDDIAAKLDALAAENNINRSEAAEHIFRTAFEADTQQAEDEEATEPVADSDYLLDQLLELRDYMTLLYSRHDSLRSYVLATLDYEEAPAGTYLPKTLPEPPWVRRSHDS